MRVYDIKPREEWQRVSDEIYKETEMPSAVLDSKKVILQTSGKRNPLCAIIRAIKESKSFICGQTQAFMAEKAKETRKSVIDACEAGMLKFVIPLFYKGKWEGSLTACGAGIPDAKIEGFIIAKSTNMNEEEIEELAQSIPEVDPAEISEAANQLFKELKEEQ